MFVDTSISRDVKSEGELPGIPSNVVDIPRLVTAVPGPVKVVAVNSDAPFRPE